MNTCRIHKCGASLVMSPVSCSGTTASTASTPSPCTLRPTH